MTDTTLSEQQDGKGGMFTMAALQKVVAFAVLVIMLLFFSIFAPNFAAWNNMVNIMQATAVNGVLGVAVTFVIIAGGIDLAVGTMMTLTAVVAGLVLTNLGLPLPLGIVGALASGGLMGAFSGWTIAKLKIPPFIATLGMMQIARGLALVFSEAKPIYFNSTPSYQYISPESSITLLIPGLEIPNGVFIMFIVAIIASIMLNRTILGNSGVQNVGLLVDFSFGIRTFESDGDTVGGSSRFSARLHSLPELVAETLGDDREIGICRNGRGRRHGGSTQQCSGEQALFHLSSS